MRTQTNRWLASFTRLTSGKHSARDCFVTFSRLGWLKPGVSAIYPPPDNGSKETWRVVCFPLPLLADTSPTR
ncbi:hypothetical protein HanRHA438_Chr08g0329581 [Helianthus annuus]|nr:hypothetical protein HanRHA438_Chr08g0329581 [Helianthus annuus]